MLKKNIINRIIIAEILSNKERREYAKATLCMSAEAYWEKYKELKLCSR